jgi:hypothetical protein
MHALFGLCPQNLLLLLPLHNQHHFIDDYVVVWGGCRRLRCREERKKKKGKKKKGRKWVTF